MTEGPHMTDVQLPRLVEHWHDLARGLRLVVPDSIDTARFAFHHGAFAALSCLKQCDRLGDDAVREARVALEIEAFEQSVEFMRVDAPAPNEARHAMTVGNSAGAPSFSFSCGRVPPVPPVLLLAHDGRCYWHGREITGDADFVAAVKDVAEWLRDVRV